jgi:hypothetical protein
MGVVLPESFGISYEIEYPVRTTDLAACTRPDLRWGQPAHRAVAGVDVEILPGGQFALYVVIRAPEPGNVVRDVWLAYLWQDNVWRALAGLLVDYNVGWTVINGAAERETPTLNFATLMQPVRPAGGSFRRTYLADWGQTTGKMVQWKDKPHPEHALKGQETGYRYRAVINRVQALQWSLLSWSKRLVWTPNEYLMQGVPCTGEHRPCPGLRPLERADAGVEDVALDEEVYHVHLTRTGLRRADASLSTYEPFPASFAVAGMLADVGIERLLGR